MRFDLVNDPDAMFSIIAKQQRDQAVFEANDAERRQTAKRRDARSMAHPGTKPRGSAADEHDSPESAEAASVKESGTVISTTTSVLFVASRVTSSGTASKASRLRGRRPWPKARPDPQAAAAAAHKRSRSAYPEQDYR